MLYETLPVFPTHVYRAEAPHLLGEVSSCADDFLRSPAAARYDDDGLPLTQTENFFNDERAALFCEFVAYRCWKILEEQGFVMEHLHVHFSEMWAQEHRKGSFMEPHTHTHGSVLCGFYFLETPEGSPQAAFYDPRPGKVQSNFGEKQSKQAIYAHDKIQIPVKAGDLVITNSWLGHGFSPNRADKPFKFVHFNVVLQHAPPIALPEAEIV